MTISIRFPQLNEDQKDLTKVLIMEAYHWGEVDEIGWQGNKYVLDFTARELGHYSAPILVQPPLTVDWLRDFRSFNFSVVADFDEFVRSCLAATQKLEVKFSHATARVNLATKAYRDAFQDQEEALNRVAEKEKVEKMRDEMLWGAFMAVLAGPIGSLGAWVAELHEGSEIAKEGICDLTKELTKFSIESLRKMGEKGDEVELARKPAGHDPLEFLVSFSAMLDKEKENNSQRLLTMNRAAGAARDKKRGVVFEQDPEKMVERDRQIDSLSRMSIRMEDYLRQLWAVWLGQFGEEEIKRRIFWSAIRAEINRAAKLCGEGGNDWLKAWFAGMAKARRKKAAEGR